MTELLATSVVSTTQHFKCQLESFCQLERISPDETRKIGKAIIERVCHAHGGNIVFCSSGCQVQVSVKLENGGIAKMLITFDNFVPESRSILKTLSAQVVRHGQE